jgi:hypothetical protein
LLLSLLLLASPQGQPIAPLPRVDLVERVQSHFDALLPAVVEEEGLKGTGQWLASLDLTTGRYPVNQPKAAAGPRVYRHIDAPFGATFYWDLAQLQAALRLAERVGGMEGARLRAAAHAYLDDSLTRLVGDNGLLAWGNHYFYDVYADEVVGFGYSGAANPTPAPVSHRGYHELRPAFVPWGRLAARQPATVDALLYAMGDEHLVGGWAGATGAFDRHATAKSSGRTDYPFLEAGAVLIDALSWMEARGTSGRGAEPGDRAEAIRQYVHGSRHPATGLIPNQQVTLRWDAAVTTSEIGLWASGLLRGAERLPRFAVIWRQSAADALLPWLDQAWDPVQRRYVGKVRVADGTPEFARTTDYQPADYSRAWNGFFPTHDYLIELGQAVVALGQVHADPLLPLAAERIAMILREERPVWNAHDGQGAYSGRMGRAIRFLLAAGRWQGRADWLEQAQDLAYEALLVLGDTGILRTHGGEERYDAVDEVGELLLAFLELRTLAGDLAPQTLARYSFGDGQFQLTADDAAPGVLAEAVTVGPGLTLTSSTRGDPPPSLAATSVDADAATMEVAWARGDDMRLAIRAAATHDLWLAGVQLAVQRSGGSEAPTHYAVRSSLDGFTQNLACDRLESDRFGHVFVPLRGLRLAAGERVELRVAFFGGAGTGNRYARLDEVRWLGRARRR